MTRICFVSYEIHPTTWGGCGVLLHNAAHVLLKQGHTIIFLLDVPHKEFVRFRDQDRLKLPHAERCQAYHVDTLCDDISYTALDFKQRFAWLAYRFHYAAQKVAALEQPDVIEFFDYGGVAHYALAAKLTQNAYPDSLVTVRLHNPEELMDRQEATKFHDLSRNVAYALEHHALRLAEWVMYPSEGYLTQAYQPHYEHWFGQPIHSKPPLIIHPTLAQPPTAPNLALFYGRLYGFKGVDLFVDAAVNLLYHQPDLDLNFCLVGHDSHKAPDGSGAYQAYLWKKIPPHFHNRFEFKGHLSWQQLGELLPHVQFAVFPGYFESFCYAAHELYAAGVPILINDLPAFQDYFVHGKNALKFNGSVSDLTQQMQTLATDATLRARLQKPYSVSENPLGAFYDGPFQPTWIQPVPKTNPSLLVCILGTDSEAMATTLDTVSNEADSIILGYPHTDPALSPSWFLGQLYSWFDVAQQPIVATNIQTGDALLILRAGDVVSPGYLAQSVQTLARQPQLSFVTCWHKAGHALDLFPWDAALELWPILRNDPLSRAVMRTPPQQLLVDLFDPRLSTLSEIGYLWHLEDTCGPGITIPDVLLHTALWTDDPPNLNVLSHLLVRDTSTWRHKRLANYLIHKLGHTDHSPELEAKLAHYEAEIQAMRSTKGWRLLEKYWSFRDRVKAWMRR